MINRMNYLMVQEFLIYRREVIQNSENTIDTYWVALRHLLNWADGNHLNRISLIRPTFPEFIASNREDGLADKPLSIKYQSKILGHAREFLKWASANVSSMSMAKNGFIDTIVVRKSRLGERIKKREYYTIDEITKISRLQPKNLRQQRDIAAVCFMFLSSMRIGAFVSLPCGAVDINRRRVEQSPDLGVNTKNSKAAITFLLPIEELLIPVKRWDEIVRPISGDDGYWFASLMFSGATESYAFSKKQIVIGNTRDRENIFRDSLRIICELAKIPYKSPHKIRHGFGVYGIKHAKNVGEMKAISQNMMHANMGITDGLYGKLAEEDLDDIMGTFGK